MSLKILVIEDEDSNMHILTIGLRHMGHRVTGAYTPELGLAMAAEEQPDVILMDLMFPGASMDGLEAIRRLRANPVTAAIPVVAQTASVLEYSELCARGAGAEGFLRKPFRRRDMVEALHEAIRIAAKVQASRAGGIPDVVT